MRRSRALPVLVVDDEPSVRFGLREYLGAGGYEVIEAERQKEARDWVAKRDFGAILLDLSLPDGNGMDLLREIRSTDPAVPILIVSGTGTIALAVEAMREGADQFLTKPVDMKQLEILLASSLRLGALRRENRVLRERPAPEEPFLGKSDAIRALEPLLVAAARHQTPVLLRGETGTGKGLMARRIHGMSPLADAPFVELNCAGLRGDFLESELFGHTKGAFTGATERKEGLLERAHRGTLFLDEIGDMDPIVQAKFLKVLEEKRFRPLGSVEERRSEFRLISATLQDLENRINMGLFRRDLLFRINTLTVTLPPLRELTEDLPDLIEHTLARLSRGKQPPTVTPEAQHLLSTYGWPGNIRELSNVLERAYILSDGQHLGIEHFQMLRQPSPPAPLQPLGPRSEAEQDAERAPEEIGDSLPSAEKRHIVSVLRRTKGDIATAARLLEISKATLYRKVHDFGIPLDSLR